MKREDKTKTKMDSSEGIELKPLCDDAVAKITSEEVALSKPFNIVNLSVPHMKHLHIRGYVDFYGGYAEHSRQVLDNLHNTGKYCLKLTPIRTPIDIDPIVWNRMNQYVHNTAFNIDKSTFMCIGCPGWFREEFMPKERKAVAWTMIETDRLQPQMVEWLNNANVVWNPTEVDRNRMKRSGVKSELDVVHLGFDDNKYKTDVRALDIPQLRNRYVFGVLGSWNTRKGIKEIIHAYVSEFKPSDHVSLFMVCKYGTRPYEDDKYGREKDDKESWTIKYEFDQYLKEVGKTYKEIPHIGLLDIPVHENILPNIMARFNCLVGFSRGESTWLPGLQGMAMGIPIIQLANEQTNGFMDYLNDVAFLCEETELYDCDEEDYKGTSELYEGCKLAKGNIEELAHTMKRMYNYGDAAKESHQVLTGLQKAKDWTWSKTVEQINERLL